MTTVNTLGQMVNIVTGISRSPHDGHPVAVIALGPGPSLVLDEALVRQICRNMRAAAADAVRAESSARLRIDTAQRARQAGA
ncbi:hypothetical protein [Amycolatopsis samaneae]|uniref:Uncharacterized protein n=1 Tax=Amycolatopsis samaneae TaxID=664691 RepID=A0ABW5GBP4_9PSEU